MTVGFNGATLRTRGIRSIRPASESGTSRASMGPRLGRVEYSPVAVECQICIVEALQWGHA